MRHVYFRGYLRLLTASRTLVLLMALVLPAAAWAQTIKLEAENATLVGLTVATTLPGYSGTGYVVGFDAPQDSLVFTFPATANRYNLTIRYASPSGARTTTAVVNGVASAIAFANNAGFATLAAGHPTLRAGQNTLTIRTGQGYFAIDYITLTPVPTVVVPLVNGRAEAEQGYRNYVTVATSPAGFSGTGYVTGFTNSDTANVNISFNAPAAGLYRLTIGYTSPFGVKGYNLTVNDEGTTGLFTGTTAAANFGAKNAGNFLLPAGLTSVVIGGNYGYYGIDYVEITPVTTALPVRPPKQLSDPLATPSARSLFAYITDLYGTKVLSGQQDDQMGNPNSEVAYVLRTTGKEPAMASMDLFDYSYSQVQKYGQPTGTTERFLAWATRGNARGIVSLIWHWRAPADLNNPNAPEGAFYSSNTSFNLTAVLADTAGTRYHLLLRDIDSIASQLKKFQRAGVPVLWRPVHESPGNFFWWNNGMPAASAPASFKTLWQLLYTRLTTRHRLHNLIWVYSANDVPSAAWYPGDAYVDITGTDVYKMPSANMTDNWAAMQTQFAPRKLVALTESGTLTDPDRVRGYATWWSWFCGWQGSYIRTQPTPFLQRVYLDADVITRDELPNWYTYALAAKVAVNPAELSVYPNPASGYMLNVRLELTSSRAVAVTLVNSLGQQVAAASYALRGGANEFQVPIAGLAPGMYQLVVRTPGQPAMSRRVVLAP